MVHGKVIHPNLISNLFKLNSLRNEAICKECNCSVVISLYREFDINDFDKIPHLSECETGKFYERISNRDYLSKRINDLLVAENS